MKKYLILFCSLILFWGCKDKDESRKNRLYLKEIQVNGKIIEWFYFSLVGNTTADYVLLYDPVKDKNDTIVNSTNLKDISLSGKDITLFFYGKPRIYEESIKIENNVDGLNIKIDTTAIFTEFKPRNFYQKKN